MSTITHEPLQKIRDRRKHISHTLTSEQKAEIVNAVCDRIARGEHLHDISEESEMPHANTIRNWIDADPELRKAYRRAQVIRSEIVAESVIKIADEPPPTYRDSNGQERIDTGGVQLRRLRIMARQWFATAHLRRWQAEAEAEAAADRKSQPKPDPDAQLLASLPEYVVPTPDEVRFKTLQYSPFSAKRYQALVRQSQIEGCTPHELWERTKDSNPYDYDTDTWRPTPPPDLTPPQNR